LPAPNRPGWTLERKLAESPLCELWLASKHLGSGSVEATLSLSVADNDFAVCDQRALLLTLRVPATGGRAKWLASDPIACVLVASGDRKGVFAVLSEDVLSAGRDPTMNLHLNDPKVSRAHFEIHARENEYTVKALRSKNGVFVNGIKIEEEQHLQNGDEIRVGQTELHFYDDRGDS
jgi:hypothetical protein